MSGCACGHHHHDHAPMTDALSAGQDIALDKPLIALSGALRCQDMTQMLLALDLLPDHVRLSRAEPGNLRFDLVQQDDPMIWRLEELFADADAFAAHQTRTLASRWGQDSADMLRDFHRAEVTARLRPEQPQDHTAISALLQRSFGGPVQALRVESLRDHDQLALSLVAHAAGTVIGHLALARTPKDQQIAGEPDLSLESLAVHPAVRCRDIAAALVHAALGAFPGHSFRLDGQPGYFARFGFQIAPGGVAQSILRATAHSDS